MAGMQECENCHAPLPLGAPGAIVECTYCRVQNRVAGATGVMPVAPHGGFGAPPASGYGAPPTPYGQAPASGHGAPLSPYGQAPMHGYGPPHAHVPLAVPVRHPSNPGAMIVVIAVLGVLVTCGMGMAVWLLTAVR